MSDAANHILWWIIPETLAGMPMPFIHPERRMNHGGALEDYADDLPTLYAAGIRGVVSLLNLPSDESVYHTDESVYHTDESVYHTDESVYHTAGISFLCLPVPDGGAPTFEQASEFVHFVDARCTSGQAVAVHCEAGLGRTGTMLAVYLISQGDTAANAIRQIRAVEKSAVETNRQIQFLEMYAEHTKTSA